MKKCPICNRTYADDTLAFCLADGSLLSASYDPEATQHIPPWYSTNSNPTEVLTPASLPGAHAKHRHLLDSHSTKKEIEYYRENDLIVTSNQIRSKTITLMIEDIGGVEFSSESNRTYAVVFLIICSYFFRNSIYDSGNTPTFRIIVGGLALLVGLFLLYVLFVGFGSVYVNSQGQRIKVVDGFGPEMRKLKQAIEDALLNKKSRDT